MLEARLRKRIDNLAKEHSKHYGLYRKAMKENRRKDAMNHEKDMARLSRQIDQARDELKDLQKNQKRR